jgi:hypothetical protein
MVKVRSSPNDTAARSWSWRTRCMLLILALLGVKLLIDAFNEGGGGDYLKTFTSADALVPKVDETPPYVSPAAENTTPELAAAAHTPTFLSLAEKYGTDKVRGTSTLPACRENTKNCPRPEAINEGCKVTGHFYDSLYQKWLVPLAAGPAFQFLEIGYFNGKGFDAYTELLPNAEKHSLEIACIPAGPRSEGKWPWGNFAQKNPNYQTLLDADRLHCGDASDFLFLHTIWMTHMKRPDAPPLKVVVEDASHLSEHMVTSVFFWFPRLEPGGLLFVEDIESQTPANAFRTNFLPQLFMDLNYCGVSDDPIKNKLCFPTLQPFLKGIHCELHMCVLERNDRPAVEYDKSQSMPPANALDLMKCRQ